MKDVCDLDRARPTTAGASIACRRRTACCWASATCASRFPSINLVFDQPRALLGEAVHARFGDEFPIRFDFLDTMGGGNLSFQVHPLTEYIQQHFGMHYTQDESYYMLDAGPDAGVYLGLREGVDPDGHGARPASGASRRPALPGRTYANRWPAKKHDHFLIPAGTAIAPARTPWCSRSAPRPISSPSRCGIGAAWASMASRDRSTSTTAWRTSSGTARPVGCERNLVNRIEPLASGDGWREERTGPARARVHRDPPPLVHGAVPHDTRGGVNVLNLVEGARPSSKAPTAPSNRSWSTTPRRSSSPPPSGGTRCGPVPGGGRTCGTVTAFIRTEVRT